MENFITAIIDDDVKSGKHSGRIMTRFPPEPNGYLHIGHAKSICLNFGLAQQYQAQGGTCNLRFDDTNPLAEDIEFINSIQADVKWLGFDWGQNLFFASDQYDKLYELAEELIRRGKAYVCSLTADEVRAYRGTLTEPGRNSPYRDRSVEENLDLFRRMKAGEFKDGAHTLRAKIDMASPNINLRDPALYRIRHEHHPKTGDTWCIYPMYDYAHGLCDAFEGVTHSICTLEFEAHRPLYDWILDQLPRDHEYLKSRPQQIEFARLNLSYTVVSKRKLKQLVEEGHVTGWDDPRMPTMAGIRRRGYPPAALRDFCERIGVARADSTVDIGMLEFCVRDELDRTAPRAMGVLRPLKVVIESYEAGKVEEIQSPRHQAKPELGTRTLYMTREIYLDAEDFMEDPPKDYHRLAPGREVRLRNSYIIKCEKVIKDAAGKVVELRCSHDPSTLGKAPADGRKVKGIVHWVSASHAEPAEIRLYDRLFTAANPNDVAEGEEFTKHLNPASCEVIQGFVEKSLKTAEAPQTFQFERLGYFCVDSRDSKPGKLVFNRTVGLKDGFK